MFVDLSKSVHTFLICMLIWFSVKEMLLPRYTHWFTNFRGLKHVSENQQLKKTQIDIIPSNVENKKVKNLYEIFFNSQDFFKDTRDLWTKPKPPSVLYAQCNQGSYQ